MKEVISGTLDLPDGLVLLVLFYIGISCVKKIMEIFLLVKQWVKND